MPMWYDFKLQSPGNDIDRYRHDPNPFPNPYGFRNSFRWGHQTPTHVLPQALMPPIPMQPIIPVAPALPAAAAPVPRQAAQPMGELDRIRLDLAP